MEGGGEWVLPISHLTGHCSISFAEFSRPVIRLHLCYSSDPMILTPSAFLLALGISMPQISLNKFLLNVFLNVSIPN